MKEAVSFRIRKSSIYDKKSNSPFKISRSKFFNFLSCKRCFYLDRVKGLKEPSMPGWALNIAVDELLKKEFDLYRKEQKPHPVMLKHNLNFVPYQHKDLDSWRNSLKGGISYLDEKTNLIIHVVIDDLCFDLIEKKIGRKKTKKNDPRVCDIDIIDFKGLVIDENNLKIPHKKCHLSNFVLYPIQQIDSGWVHPVIKKNVKFLINKLDQKSRIEITRLNKNVIINS